MFEVNTFLKSKKPSDLANLPERHFSREILFDLPESASGRGTVGHEADSKEVAGRLGDGRRLIPAGSDDHRRLGPEPVVKLKRYEMRFILGSGSNSRL